VRPDVLDEVRAADLLLAFREDLQVHGHLVDIADRLPREQMIRERAFRVRRTARDDRPSDARDGPDGGREGRDLPGIEVADGLDVVHLVLDEGDRRADIQFADHEGMAALLPGPGLAADFRHHLTNHLGALGDALTGRTDRGLAQQLPGGLECLREAGLQRPPHCRRHCVLHVRGERPAEDKPLRAVQGDRTMRAQNYFSR
jgi:hypothetical protein